MKGRLPMFKKQNYSNKLDMISKKELNKDMRVKILLGERRGQAAAYNLRSFSFIIIGILCGTQYPQLKLR